MGVSTLATISLGMGFTRGKEVDRVTPVLRDMDTVMVMGIMRGSSKVSMEASSTIGTLDLVGGITKGSKGSRITMDPMGFDIRILLAVRTTAVMRANTRVN